MEPIGTLFEETEKRLEAPPLKDAKSERGELLREFRERINNARKGTRYPAISMGRMARLLTNPSTGKSISTQWLHYLMAICKNSNNFSATFFSRLKEEKEAIKKGLKEHV